MWLCEDVLSFLFFFFILCLCPSSEVGCAEASHTERSVKQPVSNGKKAL